MGQPYPSDCERSQSVISASLDGEISEVEQAKLDLHLASCAACQAYAAGVAETTRMLRAAPPEELGFAIVLPSRRLRLARTLQVGAAAAAVAVTVALSAAIGTTRDAGLTSASASAGASAAYLQSPEYELSLLQQAAAASIPAHAHYSL
jgi:predicted anti-sigma-YlaC factor YlaD